MQSEHEPILRMAIERGQGPLVTSGTRLLDATAQGRATRERAGPGLAASSELVLRPSVERVVDRQLELELALVVHVEERETVGDREEPR